MTPRPSEVRITLTDSSPPSLRPPARPGPAGCHVEIRFLPDLAAGVRTPAQTLGLIVLDAVRAHLEAAGAAPEPFHVLDRVREAAGVGQFVYAADLAGSLLAGADKLLVEAMALLRSVPGRETDCSDILDALRLVRRASIGEIQR